MSGAKMSGAKMSRRALLGAAAAALASGPAFARAPEKTALLVRVSRPPQLETPVTYLDETFTPNPVFFVRSHFDVPALGLFAPRLAVGGLAEKPFSISAEELAKLDSVELPAVLQCSGNGRGLHAKPVPGVQWEKGAVGNARWRGVKLATLLERAHPKKDAQHVHVRGSDTPPHPDAPPFVRSITLERALAADTLVAFRMNGQALPHLHGGPLRLVIPGWAGNHWMKWLSEITLAAEPAKGFFMETAYQMPAAAGSEQYAVLTALPVKSWITRPLDGSVLGKKAVPVRGHAFSGHGKVTRVEISADGGKTWADAKVEPLASLGTWQRFTYTWKPAAAGKHELLARATDATGAVQPEVTPANRSGYFWNGWDRVAVEVRA